MSLQTTNTGTQTSGHLSSVFVESVGDRSGPEQSCNKAHLLWVPTCVAQLGTDSVFFLLKILSSPL